MISPETVTVISDGLEYDDLGEPVGGTATETDVSAVVAPGATGDLGSDRPEGVKVAYTLHFPKTWTASLRGCKVRVRGELYSVVGDPQAYTAENTPGKWNRPVEVTRTDG